MKFTVNEIYDLMRARFMASRIKKKTMAEDPVAFYGFKPEDVAVVHYPRQATARDGIWFALKDGRFIDLEGRSCDHAPAQYEAEAVVA